VYCYATRDVETARKCHEKHDPEGESLAAVPQSRGIPEA
jgi:hypothetical protein